MKKTERPQQNGIHLSFDTQKDPWILGIIALTVVTVLILTFIHPGNIGGNPLTGMVYSSGNTFDSINHDLVVQGNINVAGSRLDFCSPGTIVYEKKSNHFYGCVASTPTNAWVQLDKP